MAPDSSPTKSEPPTKTKDVAPDPTNAYCRLHITPLDQDLLEIVLPASVLPHARNISLHTLETFPEKRYGFVDLPLADAEKLKKRLNGTTLKGTRMRVEKARAEERREPTGHASDADAKTSKKRKAADGQETSEKRKPKRKPKPKRDVNVIEGVVLKDRKVKRGWTESTDTKVKNKRSSRDKSSAKDKDQDQNQNQEKKRKRPKSKYTDQDECLLKTRLPPNAVGNLPAAGEAYKKKGKKKGREGNAREIIVHEFEKTTIFPGFLKNEVPHRQGKEAVDFVDSKGWVDEDGNLVEAVEVKVRANDGLTKAKPNKNRKPVEKKIEAQEPSDDDSTSSSGTSSEEEDSDSDTSDSGAPEDIQMLQKGEDAVSKKDQSDASSGSSSDEDGDEDGDGDGDEAKEQTTRAGQEDSRPMSSSSSRSLTIQIPPPTTPGKVHPLEALYKRPKPDGAVALAAPAESFTFFATGAQDDDHEDEGTPAVTVPMTPFTRQDLEWRNVRSAAPTPDTAHPSRMKNFWTPDDDEEDGVHEDEEGDKETRPDGQQGTSDFQSWFWENRRNLNKSWMARRKAAAKEKRHRENKSRASKAI
ncbi:hypothetical protein C2857_006345 [Epichloe festucae Fl1]|uniref:Uncharacterized protein n=1 Tax=Epichloe festucae (strain Fl1) TaxID=877507 RepID=A0A7S9PSN0_EPIFF|nr:hypothetical protein C2857_006345 [Epichloe festucae Fl1]